MKEIKIPVLNTEYSVIVCWGSSSFIAKVLESWGHSEESRGWAADCFQDSFGLCFTTVHCHPVVALPRPPKTPADIGTLAHEATHAIEHIFARIKQPLGGEIFADSVGAVVRETLKMVKK